MTQKLIALLFSIALVHLSWGQSITPQVIASSGKSSSAGGFVLDYTVGELAVKTLNSSGNMVTQGFHQTYAATSSVNNGEDIELQIQVYPNPSYDFINIVLKTDLPVEFTATVHDVYGKVILLKNMSVFSSMQLDISSLAAGNYFISLFNAANNAPIKTIQIQKLSNQ